MNDEKKPDSFDDEIKKILDRDPIDELERGEHKMLDPYLDEPLPPPEAGALDDTDEFDGKFNSPMSEYYNLSPEEKLRHITRVGALKSTAMLLTGDTTGSDEIGRYLSITKQLGFKTVLDLPFQSKHGENERFFIQWRKDGLLLAFDTWHNQINSGHVYYNWTPTKARSVTSSGGFIDRECKIWAGDHDCREALVFNIRQLEQNGDFLPKWVGYRHLWLIHHGDKVDWRDGSSDLINAERIALLPPEVREAIGEKL